MSIIDDIYLAQRNAGEAAVIANLEKQGLIPHRNQSKSNILQRCLSVISTLEGECSTEQEMLNALTQDIKQELGITPLIPGSLI